jgi:hypothetical protein
MEREWAARANWLKQAEQMKQRQEEHWNNLRSEEQATIGGVLRLYEPGMKAEDREWGESYKELHEFYKYAQHEPLPHEGTTLYRQLEHWVEPRGPANWAFQPQGREELRKGLERRNADLEDQLSALEEMEVDKPDPPQSVEVPPQGADTQVLKE